MPRPDPCAAAGLALTALTGPLLGVARTDEAAALPSRIVLSSARPLLAASDAHPASDPLPGVTGYRTPRSGSRNPRAAGPGGAAPVPAATLDASAPPTPGSPSQLASRLYTASMACPDPEGSALPAPRPHGQDS